MGKLFFRNFYSEYLPADGPVAVDVVEAEGPPQLILNRPSTEHRQTNDKVGKGDQAIVLRVEGVEDKVGVLPTVRPLHKELRKDVLESVLK